MRRTEVQSRCETETDQTGGGHQHYSDYSPLYWDSGTVTGTILNTISTIIRSTPLSHSYRLRWPQMGSQFGPIRSFIVILRAAD